MWQNPLPSKHWQQHVAPVAKQLTELEALELRFLAELLLPHMCRILVQYTKQPCHALAAEILYFGFKEILLYEEYFFLNHLNNLFFHIFHLIKVLQYLKYQHTSEF